MNHLITWCYEPFIYLTLTVSVALHLMNERPSRRSSQPRLLQLPLDQRWLIWRQSTCHGHERWRNEWGMLSERALFDGTHLRGLDVEIKEVEQGSHTSFHIPPSLCSVILPCSIVALLIASRFSKGRSISSGSIPRLCLILFCTFVGARKLIKEHLITIACCQWMILNRVTVL